MNNVIDKATAQTGLTTMVVLLGTMVLPAAFSASTARADVFNIEIDYMVDSNLGGHSHRPNDIEIDAVVQMFACQGHTLNIIVDDELPHYTQLRNDPDDCQNTFDYSGTNASFGRLKQDYYDHAGVGGWHYCIFVHFIEDGACNFTGSSGRAEIGGDDFVVSLGDFDGDIGTPWDRAATLAHEFGHNLGLYHCGSAAPCGNPDADPSTIGPRPLNLASIMSYFYQLRGVRANLECQGLVTENLSLFKNLDYSHGTMCTLDEAALNEPRGTGMRAVDWNCNGVIAGVVAHDLHEDSDGWCGAISGLQVLSDFDEWANIQDSTRDRSKRLDHLPVSTCIGFKEITEDGRTRGGCPQPPAIPEPCVAGKMIYVTTSDTPNPLGTCDVPYDSVGAAHDNAEPGSLLFLAPGDYIESPSLILDTNIILNSTGSAVIR